VDAKGSVAAQVLAVNHLLSTSQIAPEDVSMLFVVGEEVGGAGMQLANDLQLRPRAVIFGEPTEGKLVAGHKGIIVVQIRTMGRAAHSGYPWLGLSATDVLVAAAASLQTLGDSLPQSPKYGKTTLNLGLLNGGVALNVVPESASAGLAVRIAAGSPAEIESAITTTVHNAVAPFLTSSMKLSDVVQVEFRGVGYGPIDLDADVPGFEVMTVNYGSDIPWLKKTVPNQKRYLYGPGSIFVAHTDHESLTEKELYGAAKGYERIVLHALEQMKREGSGD
jgi:acetylornithine deacetylase